MPCCRKPIAPAAVPAASGRTLMAPAAALLITKALATITIIWVPNSQSGAWLVPTMLKVRFSRAPANCSASPNQINFSSEWRGAKRTQNRLPTRYANPVVAADHGADAVAAVEVANDSAAHHHAGGAAERLQESCGDQLRQRLRQRAADAGRHHQGKAREQHRTAAVLVRQRPHDELRAG